jgi:hypothetical protein
VEQNHGKVELRRAKILRASSCGSGRRSGDPSTRSGCSETKIYVRCSKGDFFSPFDRLQVLSTPTIFPMMPDRVDTPILTITR